MNEKTSLLAGGSKASSKSAAGSSGDKSSKKRAGKTRGKIVDEKQIENEMPETPAGPSKKDIYMMR